MPFLYSNRQQAYDYDQSFKFIPYSFWKPNQMIDTSHEMSSFNKFNLNRIPDYIVVRQTNALTWRQKKMVGGRVGWEAAIVVLMQATSSDVEMSWWRG